MKCFDTCDTDLWENAVVLGSVSSKRLVCCALTILYVIYSNGRLVNYFLNSAVYLPWPKRGR